MLNNLSSIDLEEPQKKKKSNHQKILGVYEAERLIAKRTNGEVTVVFYCSKTTCANDILLMNYDFFTGNYLLGQMEKL